MSWVCHNDVGLLWNWYQPSTWQQDSCNIIVNCQQDTRFLDTHNILQARQLFVSWIPYGQEISIPLSTRPTYNARYCNIVVGFFNSPDVMSWVCHNDVGLLWNWYQPSAWWQGGCNIIVNYQQDTRFSDTHTALQARQLFVSWIPDYNTRSYYCQLSTRYQISETYNGLQTKQPSVSFGPYMAFHMGKHLESNQLYCQIIYITGLSTNKGSTQQLPSSLAPGNIKNPSAPRIRHVHTRVTLTRSLVRHLVDGRAKNVVE